jgi:predicted metal-dependent peptidase
MFDEARVKLVMKFPFFGSLIYHMPVRERSALEMMATVGMPTAAVVTIKEGKNTRQELWYAREFVEPMDRAERMFLLAHEVLHPALGHHYPWRIGNRDAELWNSAGDYVINPIVIDSAKAEAKDGKPLMTMPKNPDGTPNGLYDERFRGMSTEQVYDILKKEQKKGGGKGKGKCDHCHSITQIVIALPGEGDPSPGKDGKDGKDGNGKPNDDPLKDGIPQGATIQKLDEASGRAMEEKWKTILVRATAVAKAQGKCPAGMDRLVEDMLQPKIPWQTLLARYVTEVLRDDYDWMRADRRYLGGMTIIGEDGQVNRDQAIYMPDLMNEATEVVVAVDTSGSIGDRELHHFLSEAVAMLRCRNVKRIRLMACDAKVTLDEWIGPQDPLPKNLPGGGGTDFRPVFKRLEKDPNFKPKLLVYMTDLMGSFPDESDRPPYDVIWLSATHDYAVPFGVHLEYDMDSTPEELAA